MSSRLSLRTRPVQATRPISLRALSSIPTVWRGVFWDVVLGEGHWAALPVANVCFEEAIDCVAGVEGCERACVVQCSCFALCLCAVVAAEVRCCCCVTCERATWSVALRRPACRSARVSTPDARLQTVSTSPSIRITDSTSGHFQSLWSDLIWLGRDGSGGPGSPKYIREAHFKFRGGARK